jgi:hypothetical protein
MQMNKLTMCRNFIAIEWHQKTYHKISCDYLFTTTVTHLHDWLLTLRPQNNENERYVWFVQIAIAESFPLRND